MRGTRTKINNSDSDNIVLWPLVKCILQRAIETANLTYLLTYLLTGPKLRNSPHISRHAQE